MENQKILSWGNEENRSYLNQNKTICMQKLLSVGQFSSVRQNSRLFTGNRREFQMSKMPLQTAVYLSVLFFIYMCVCGLAELSPSYIPHLES